VTPQEEATAARVRANALRVRYLAHDPAVTFAEWQAACAVARALEAAARPGLALIPGGAR